MFDVLWLQNTFKIGLRFFLFVTCGSPVDPLRGLPMPGEFERPAPRIALEALLKDVEQQALSRLNHTTEGFN